MEVLAESVVLDVVPTHANAQTQPTSGKQVDVRRLASDESGLSLGQDENARHVFLINGNAPQPGEMFRNPQMAAVSTVA